MRVYLWVEVSGLDWEGVKWVGRRILRFKGQWVSCAAALNAVIEAAGRELAMHGICFSNELEWKVKTTLDVASTKDVYIVDYPSKDGKPLNLVWTTIPETIEGEGVSNG